MYREFKDSGKQRFSIKKYTFGVSSVLLGTFFAVSGNVAQAEENLPSSDVVANVAVESPQVASETQNVGSIVDFDLLEEKAPAVAADSNTNPADLKYVLKKDDFPPATKVETKEVVATTEYVADDTKVYGTKAVESVAKNGQVTTTTSYTAVREVPKEVKEITEDIQYIVDGSKELPSDRIIPNNLSNKSDLFSLNDADLIPELMNRFAEELNLGAGIPSDGFKIDSVASAYYLRKAGNIEPMPNTSTDEIERYYTSHAISDSLYAKLKSERQLLEKRLPELEQEFENEKSNYGLDHLTFVDFQNVVTEGFNKQFDTVTRNYNNSRGHVGINIDHTKSGLATDERKKFDEKLKSLPVELFKNFNTLIFVKDNLGSTASGEVTGGYSNGARREIVVRTDYPAQKWPYNAVVIKNGKEYAEKREDQENNFTITADGSFELLLHELGHNIDQMAGSLEYNNNDDSDSFSETDEFRDLYKKYFKGNVVPHYYRTYIIEAFAQSFSEYVLSTIDPNNYVKKGFIKREVFDVQDTDNDGIISVRNGEGKVHKENGTYETKKFDDAYYPFEKTFPYFDDLFAKLGLWSKLPIGFRYDEKVDVKETKAENGKIFVGTKTKVQDTVLPFNTVTRQDPNLAVGLSQVLQAGKDGLKQVITKYVLKDKTTGEIETSVSENLLQAAIDEIILVGTKVVSTPTNVTPTTAKGTGVTQAVKPTLTIPVPPTPTNVTPTTAKGTGVTQAVKPTLTIPVPPTPTNVTPTTAKGTGVTQPVKPTLTIPVTPTTAKGTGVTQPVKPTLNVTPVVTKVVNTAKVTPKSSVQSNNVLPKTSASNEGSSSSLPAGLAATLIAAGLMTARKRNN